MPSRKRLSEGMDGGSMTLSMGFTMDCTIWFCFCFVVIKVGTILGEWIDGVVETGPRPSRQSHVYGK